MGERAVQLELFELTPMMKLSDRVQACEVSCNRVRKGIYAKHGALKKELDELRNEFEQLKIAICKVQS